MYFGVKFVWAFPKNHGSHFYCRPHFVTSKLKSMIFFAWSWTNNSIILNFDWFVFVFFFHWFLNLLIGDVVKRCSIEFIWLPYKTWHQNEDSNVIVSSQTKMHNKIQRFQNWKKNEFHGRQLYSNTLSHSVDK